MREKSRRNDSGSFLMHELVLSMLQTAVATREAGPQSKSTVCETCRSCESEWLRQILHDLVLHPSSVLLTLHRVSALVDVLDVR